MMRTGCAVLLLAVLLGGAGPARAEMRRPARVVLPLPPAPPGPGAPVVAPRPGPPERAVVPARPRPADIGTKTGLKLPRFASLRSDKVYLRVGPGFGYPVLWVYRRRGMPVEIEREFGQWRLVLTPDGARGWMHEATLKGRRDGIVTGARHRLRATPSPAGRVVAIVDPGVVLRLLRCDAGGPWCRVQAGGRTGWIPRRDFWGTFPGEKVPDK
jgi:SH3-like domain-containing protein